LNGTAAVLLLAGLALIKSGRREAHKRVMLGAVAVSTLFLVSYLSYHLGGAGITHFPSTRHPQAAIVYFAILATHTLLAAATLPLVILTLIKAFKGSLAAHKRLARWTFPIWLYVSITGVVIYLMLYQWFPPAPPG